jgi:cysteine desulfurase/selenocysteine lyase
MTTATKKGAAKARTAPVRVAAETPARAATPGYDVEKLRGDFPILRQKIRGKQLVYLDNAATSQKPQSVINAITRYYERDNANIHRGVHFLSEHATEEHEAARVAIQQFLNAAHEKEIIFVRGATEAINLVASSYGRTHVGAGDEVLITAMEHHSNIVPWQMLCEEKGARLKVSPINDRGELLLDEFANLLTPRTKIAAVTQVSNALGSVTPIRRMIELAHARDIPVLVDGAQAVPHLKVDVQALDCDFYAFSGHKLYGPTGIGVLYGKAALLDAMPPYQGGGDMISSVTFEKTIFNKLPFKFEAGTPDISGAIGLGAAIRYLDGIGIENVAAHEHDLLEYATQKVSAIPGIRLVGTAKEKAGVLSFFMEGIHPHDIGTILDQEGIAIRTGHHCSQPVMQRFDIPATARASFALYNTREEVDALAAGIEKVREVFA